MAKKDYDELGPDFNPLDLLKEIKKSRDYDNDPDDQVPTIERNVVAALIMKELVWRHGDNAAAHVPRKKDLTFEMFMDSHAAFPVRMTTSWCRGLDQTPSTIAFETRAESFFIHRFIEAQETLGLSKNEKTAVFLKGSRKRTLLTMALHNLEPKPTGLNLQFGFIYWPDSKIVLEPLQNFLDRIGTGWCTHE